MRLLTTLAITLIIIISLGLWTNSSLQSSTKELTRNIDRISAAIEDKRWDTAQQQTKELAGTWQEKARWWPIFLDHQEIDNIDFSLARVEKYVASQNNPLAQGQLAELRLMIKHIPEKESVNMKNIL